MRRTGVMSSPVLLVSILLCSTQLGVYAFSLGDLFGSDNPPAEATTVEDFGPGVMKTTQAAIALKAKPGATDKVIQYGKNSRVILRRDGANSLFIAFVDSELTNSTKNWATDVTTVPFMQNVSSQEIPPAQYHH